jgi:hypothetical protein
MMSTRGVRGLRSFREGGYDSRVDSQGRMRVVLRGEDKVKEVVEGDDDLERKIGLSRESGLVVLVFLNLSAMTRVHGCVGSHPRSGRTEAPLSELAGGVQCVWLA